MGEGTEQEMVVPRRHPAWSRVLLAALVIAEGLVVGVTTILAGLRAIFWVDAAGVLALIAGTELMVFTLVAVGLIGGRRWARGLASVLNLLLILLTIAATPNQVRSITLYVELHNRIGSYVDRSALPELVSGVAPWAVLLVLTVAAFGLLFRTRPAEPSEPVESSS
ncbi:MAG: hypothetical protein QOE92_679 [Chloroflexota bacterium]|jgi:hypothetical protein|nr:hypothetical protein [Chloroflexota bacterium]